MKRKLRENLTTGEISQILGVSTRTVSKWIDSGDIKGFKLPGSGDRRVSRSELIRFMIMKGIQIPDWLTANSDLNSDSELPADHVIFFKEGHLWCCVKPGFINTRQSPAGYGVTFKEAYDSLEDSLAKIRAEEYARKLEEANALKEKGILNEQS